MIRRKVDGSLERQILAAMVTSKAFLGSAAPLVDPSLLPSKYAQQLARWCIDHNARYGDAPGRGIEALYHGWVETENPDPADADAVHDFLEAISKEHDDAPAINVPVLLDTTANYLTTRRLEILKDVLSTSLLQGRRDDALAAVSDFRSVSNEEAVGYNPLQGKGALTRAFSSPASPIMSFGGDAGEFFDRALTRDSLIGIQGPEKRGKTWWCLEFMYRALRDRARVAMFQVGDLSENQLTLRMAVRIASVPLWRSQCGVAIPYPTKIDIINGKNGKEAEVTTRPVVHNQPVDLQTAYRANKTFRRRHKLPTDRPSVMFSVHSNSSINVAGINAILERWRQELEFVPDLIIIDYADILAPEDPRKDPRHQVNETWKALRKLSQDWHACVMAPTQANAASYGAKTQSMANFSEDKRKLAHVTGMLGLNATEAEKTQGVMRLNWLVLRESEFHPSRCLWVAQCIPLGMALVKATW